MNKDEGILGAIKKIQDEILGAIGANLTVENLTSSIVEVDKAASEVLKIFGQGQEMSLSLKQSMTQAVVEIDKLGGTFNDILTIQKEIAGNFGRNLVVSRDSYEGFFAAMKVTGIDSGTMVNNFKNAGISAYDSVNQMQKVVDIARESGVNVGKVSTMVTNNIGELNKYNFQGGVEGLAKMAAQATNLRIDMKDINSFASTVFKPEGAIEMAASLQRLGVAQSDLLDPLRLMDLSANDPTELQNQIVQMTSQFTKMNEAGKFEIMPGAKRQMMEIASAMNIPYETLTKMALGSADLNEKMRQIKFPKDAVSDEDKKMIANLSELNDGKAVVTFNKSNGEQVTKEVSQLTEPEISILRQGDVQKSMEQLAKQQLSVIEDMKASVHSIADRGRYTIAGSKTTSEALRLERKAYSSVAETIPKSASISSLQAGFDKTMGGVVTSVSQLMKGDFSKSFETASTTVKSLGGGIKTLVDETIPNLKKQFGNLTDEFKHSAGEFKKMSERGNYEDKNKLPVKPVSDFIKMPNETVIKPLDADMIFGGTIGKMMNPSTNQTTGTSMMKHEGDINVNLSIKIDAPQGIDMNQLQLAMNSPEISQKITSALQDSLSNGGQFGNPNQVKRNNDVRNRLVTV